MLFFIALLTCRSSSDRVGGPNCVLLHIYPKCLLIPCMNSYSFTTKFCWVQVTDRVYSCELFSCVVGPASVTFNLNCKRVMRGIVAWAPEDAELALLELDYSRKTLALEGVPRKLLDLEVLFSNAQYNLLIVITSIVMSLRIYVVLFAYEYKISSCYELSD